MLYAWREPRQIKHAVITYQFRVVRFDLQFHNNTHRYQRIQKSRKKFRGNSFITQREYYDSERRLNRTGETNIVSTYGRDYIHELDGDADGGDWLYEAATTPFCTCGLRNQGTM